MNLHTKLCLSCTAILTAFSLNASAQKYEKSSFAIFGGYEHFPEMRQGNGYNVGVEYKNYLRKRIYFVANFHAGVNDGGVVSEYDRDGIHYRFDLYNSVRDYMVGIGIGYDFLQRGKHKLYLQGTVGLGSSEQEVDGIVLSPGGAYDIVKTFEEKSTRYAISASAGYDYQLTRWLSVGVNYTGWQIGYEFKSSANVKVGFWF